LLRESLTDMTMETIQEQSPLDSPLCGPRQFDPARQALLNGCVSLAKGLLTVLVTLALTPFLVRHLGATGFGIWSLLGLFITYVALIDLGTSGAAAKFIGEHSAQEQAGQVNAIFTNSMVVVGLLAGVAVLLAFLFEPGIETALGALGLFGADARLFLFGVTALYSVGLVSNALLYVLLGLHRFDVANYVAASILFAQAVGIVIVLKANFGLQGLVYLVVGTTALSIVAYFVAAKTLAPGLCFRWGDINLQTIKKVMRLGIHLQAYALVGVYYFYIGKAVVGLRFPLAAVAAFEVALRIPILFRQGILTMLGPLMPAVSHLDARGRSEQVRNIMGHALRYCLILGAPAFVGVAIFAGPIIGLWVGYGFSSSIIPLRILSIALGLSVFPDLIWFFLVGLGKQRLAVVFSLAEVIFGTALSYFLAGRWGLAGVAFGILCTSILGAIVFGVILVREKILSRSDLPVLLGCKVTLFAGAAYAAVLALLHRFPLNYWDFSLAVITASMAYFFWLVKGGVLENKERDFLRKVVPSYLYFLC
jgi:O-antigen/teichoic acid export membrane protein